MIVRKDCRKWFSANTGTSMADSNPPLHQWLPAAYYDLTNLKGIAGMKLSGDLDNGRESAWFMLQRLRDAFMSDEPPAEFHSGAEFQVDEVYRRSRKQQAFPGSDSGWSGRCDENDRHLHHHVESGKVWADVIPDTRANTTADIVHRIVPSGSTLYTDDGRHYRGINRKRHAVNHSLGE